MQLRSALSPAAILLLVLAHCGCAGDPPARLAAGTGSERALDSVIAGCRDSLEKEDGNPGLHLRLARALLERSMLHQTQIRNMFWSQYWIDGPTIATAGDPLDSVPPLKKLDTLRDAASHAERAIALSPGYAAAYRLLGRLYMTLGSGWVGDSTYAKATAAFDSSLSLDSSSAEGYYGLGCALFRRNMQAQAIAALNKSLSIDSSNGSTYLTLGEVYLDTGNVPIAYACFENAAGLGLASAGEYIQLARHYRDEQAERRLLGRFASLRTDAPVVLRPTVRSALRMISIYHPGIALDLCSRALTMDTSCAEALLLEAGVHIEEGDTAQALDEYLQAFDNGSANYWFYEGFPREFLLRASERRPGSDALVLLIGPRMADSSSPGDAIAAFRALLEKHPESPVPAYLQGEAYVMRHDTARALPWFDRVMAIPPRRYPFMYWNIYLTYLSTDRIQAAVQVYRKCLIQNRPLWTQEMYRKEPGWAQYPREKMLLAASYCAVGFDCAYRVNSGAPGFWKTRAEGLFRQAMALIPQSAVPYYALGSLRFDLGEKEEARMYYVKAAAMGSTDAAQRLENLDAEK
jgi:tetratricopeptide (TPR) repeat protein